MNFFTRILFASVLLILSMDLLCQDKPLDSLLNIPDAQRDSLWIATLTNSAFSAVYSYPDYTARALEEAFHTAHHIRNRNLLPRILLIRGIAEDVKNQSDSAVYFYHQALEVAKENQDTIAEAGAYNNIGLVYWNRKKLDSALIFYRESERLFAVANGVRGLMSTMNNMGIIYQSMHRAEPALRYFRRLLATSRKEGSLYFESVAYTNIANTYGRINQHDSVLYYTRLAIPVQIEDGNMWGLAKSYYNLARALEGINQTEEARQAFYDALNIQKQLNNKKGLAETYVFLARNYRSAGDADKFMEYMQMAQALEQHYDDIKLKTDINEALTWQRVRALDRDLYYDLIRFSRIKDSLHNAAVEGKILDLQEAYEAEKKEQRISAQILQIDAVRRKNRTQMQIGALLGGIALALILALLAFVLYRRKVAALEKQQALHQERSRISKDLHDNVGAHLTSISMRLDMLQHGLKNENYSSTDIERLRQESAQTIDVLRDTIWAINQDIFSLEEFAQRVEQYGQRILPPQVSFSVVKDDCPDIKLESHKALHLFRVLQEALQNTMKHANASKVQVHFNGHNGLRMTISDNGKGNASENLNGENHYGLENMQERVQQIGGKVIFESNEGEGFTVKVHLPANG